MVPKSRILAVALLLPPAAAGAQLPDPPEYRTAVERLAAGDTAAAVPLLRRTIEAAPRFGPAYWRLGAILSARASFVHGYESGRAEAERLLNRAAQLMDDDPLVLLEIGFVLRKQGVRVDARRVIERAERVADRRGITLPPADQAGLHYQLGLIYETYWEDRDHLLATMPPIGGFGCAMGAGQTAGDLLTVLAILAAACPEDLPDALSQVGFLADDRADEYREMLAHFRAALRADSAHADAALRLLGYLAERGEWREYDRLLRRMLLARPEEPRLYLFAGLGAHERGLVSRADTAFRRALALLPPADRARFGNIEELVPRSVRARYAALDSAGRRETARRFFAGSDPLLLSAVEERRLEHWARIAWTELRFGVPETGERGWDSDRGRVWIRYGRPVLVFQCCFGSPGRMDQPAARMEFWAYGPTGPVFSFKRLLTQRHARHTDASYQLAEDELSELAPQLYRPRGIAAVLAYPHQLVRSRGSRPDFVRVEIYAGPPLDSLRVPAGGALEAGVFVFDRDYQPMWENRRTIPRERAAVVGYTFELAPATVRFGIEARADGPEGWQRPLAQVRDTLVAPAYPPGRLWISDLLLADSISPRVPSPVRRGDLAILPNATLAFPAGRPVHLYFEVYDAAVAADGFAHYDVDITVTDSTASGLLAGVVRGLQRILGGGADRTTVHWERAWRPEGDRAVEYVSLELARPAVGDYVVAVTVRDRTSGQTAKSERRFRVVPAGR